MPGINGIATAAKIRETDTNVKLVFITVSNEFASESYAVRADDYLLKPYHEEDLLQMVSHLSRSSLESKRMIAFSDKQSIPLSSILYTSFSGHYVYIHQTTGDLIKIRTTQSAFLKLILRYPEFFSCNKGMLVNLKNVEKIEANCFVMKEGTQVPISRRKFTDAKNVYADYLIRQIRKGDDL